MNGPEQPLVTVITVTFRLVSGQREQQFRNCVESVHRQTYSAIEHLVIDGGSQDGTVELIREYEKQGKLTCISEPDKGIYDAMNKGIRLAKGKYIAFLNSDDYWHDPEGVARSVDMLERAQADFSYAPRTIVNMDGEPQYVEYPQIGSFPYTMPFCHQTMFTRTDVLRRHGGFRFPKYRSAADYDLVVRLLLSGAKPVYVTLNFTSFRLGGFSTDDESVQLSHREVEQIIEEHFGLYMEAIPAKKWIWEPSPAIPVEVLRSVEALVHPCVAAQLHGYALGLWADSCHISAGRPGITPQWGIPTMLSEPPEVVEPPTPAAPAVLAIQSVTSRIKLTTWKLFHILPLISIKQKPDCTRVYLFGLSFLYLLKIKKEKRKQSIYLFNFLPILQIRTRTK